MAFLPNQTSDRKPGDPYCRECGYDLAGLTESARCPECGGAFVDVLERHRPAMHKQGTRIRSRATIFGLPVIHIARGPVGEERTGRAKGFIAIGDVATGVLAIGGVARGGVAIGGMSVGVFSTGGMAVGLSAVGGMALGLLSAAGLAVGGLASGGSAIGGVAQGGAAIGAYTRGGANVGGAAATSNAQAADVFDSFSWFFGGANLSAISMLQPIMLLAVLTVFAALFIAIIGWLAYLRDPGMERLSP